MKSLIPIVLIVVLSACNKPASDAPAPAPQASAPVAATPAVSEVPAEVSPEPAKSNGMLTAVPNSVGCDEASAPVAVDVSWNASAALTDAVEVWLQDPSGERKLWVASGAQSQGKTGPWMAAGSEIILINAQDRAELDRIRIGTGDCNG
jgi:hypothetical protein